MAKDKNQSDSPRGFAGFQEHVSDVGSMLEEPTPGTGTVTGKVPYEPDFVLVGGKPTSPAGTTKPATPGRRIDKKTLGLVVGIGLVLVVIIANQSDTPPPPAPSENYAVNTPQSQPSAPAPTYQSASSEEMPPVGADLVLNRPQITYCISEKIRMDGMEPAVDKYDKSQVNIFNSRVNDYNSRCGSFRYKQGLLESVRADVEARRSGLEEEGRNLLR